MKRDAVNLTRLRELRTEKGVSIEDMSLQLGYEGYQAYYYKERGTRSISADDVAGISKVLNVPIQDLFFENEVTKKETNQKVI